MFNFRALLDAGADPNLGDEYVNIYHTAREKGVHSLDVMVSSMCVSVQTIIINYAKGNGFRFRVRVNSATS